MRPPWRPRSSRVRATGVEASGGLYDVAQPESVRQLAEAVDAAFGTLDIVVNNAGILTPRPLLEIAPQQWERTIAGASEDVVSLVPTLCEDSASFNIGRHGATGGRVGDRKNSLAKEVLGSTPASSKSTPSGNNVCKRSPAANHLVQSQSSASRPLLRTDFRVPRSVR